MAVRNVFSQIFARSPLNGIEQHMRKSHECASTLVPLFDAVMQDDQARVQQERERVASLERQADDCKRDLRLHLPRSLFMPMGRSDLLELISAVDRVANRARDIAGLLCGRHMRFPPATHDMFREYLQRAVDASAQAHKTVMELIDLFETGFKGSEVGIMENMIQELDRLEHENDHLQIELRERLFSIERELYAVDVMFLYRIIDWIGDLANDAQTVGSRIQLIIAR